MGRRKKGSTLSEMAKIAKERHITYGQLQVEETVRMIREEDERNKTFKFRRITD